jgi:hypothetical protein
LQALFLVGQNLEPAAVGEHHGGRSLLDICNLCTRVDCAKTHPCQRGLCALAVRLCDNMLTGIETPK